MNKKKIKMTNLKKIIILFLVALITSFFLIENLGKKLSKQLNNYVNIESKRLITNIITYSINEILEESLTENLFIVKKNNQNEIEQIDYNTKEVNRILKVLNQTIQSKFIKLEEGNIEEFIISGTFKKGNLQKTKNGIICEIPIGSLRNNPFYSNFGPIIPVRLSFFGSINSKLDTKITTYGFNSLVVEIFVNVEIEERISMPMSSKVNKVNITAPLSLKIIQGIIPEYYYTKGIEKGGFENTTQIE